MLNAGVDALRSHSFCDSLRCRSLLQPLLYFSAGVVTGFTVGEEPYPDSPLQHSTDTLALFRRIRKHGPVLVGWGNDPKLQHVLPITPNAASTSPPPAPSPTPTPWCYIGGINCNFITPGGDSIGGVFWCSDCATNPPPWGYWYIDYAINSSYPPIPGFTAVGNTSTNPTNVDCTQGCSGLKTCEQPFPACWAQIIWTASRDTLPANMVDVVFIDGSGLQAGFAWTTRPTVLDTNIVPGASPVTDQTVSLIDKQSGTPSPWPSIMVGQQVQLQASPASGLTNVQWHFDSIATSDVVADAYTKNAAVVGTPSPVQPSGNPLSFYWVSGGNKHVYVTAQYPNVQGPLIADVYYQLATPRPQPTISSTTSTVQVSLDTVGTGTQCQAPLYTFTALHLGVPCDSSQLPGISSSYSVVVPPYGAGQIAVAQLMQLTFSGTINGQTVSYTTGDINHKMLDTQFPAYGAAYAAGSTTEVFPDSPYYDLDTSKCSKVTETMNFTDYFMYQPAANGRNGGRVWVTDAIQNWNWSGTANVDKTGQWVLITTKTVNPGTVTTQASTLLPSWNAWYQAASVQFPC